MSVVLRNFLLSSPMILGVTLAISTSAIAAEVQENKAIAQTTSVAQLSDVQPTDWAFQALQSLVEL